LDKKFAAKELGIIRTKLAVVIDALYIQRLLPQEDSLA